MSFDSELQQLLNLHPEIEEVKVKYKKASTFKPLPGAYVQNKVFATPETPMQSMSELQIAADMINKGEL